MQHRRGYGHKPSPPDPLDKIADPSGLTLPDEVDPRRDPAMPAIFDQGQLGSCTANAVARCLQWDCSLDRRLAGEGDCHRRSRLDIYYGERMLEGDLGQGDTGAYGRDGFKFAQQTGVLLEHVWPYDISRYQDTPPTLTPAGTPARRHKLGKPYALVNPDVAEMKAILANRQLIAFGFVVFPSFESQEVETTGIVPMPSRADENAGSIGGHEPVLVGYLRDWPDHGLVANSWSDGWGLGGYCLFPWAYLTDPNLASDRRTIVRATA